MHKFAILSSLVLSAAALHAQCVTPTNQVLRSTDTTGNFYTYPMGAAAGNATGSFSYLMDVVCDAPITFDSFACNLNDAGAVVGQPNLVGMPTIVRIWECATTWSGNQTTPANWTLLGDATMTILGYNVQSIVVPLMGPMVLGAGAHGIAIEVQAVPGIPSTQPTTPPTVTSYAPLHPIFHLNPNNGMPIVQGDSFITIQNQGLQMDSFLGGVWTTSGTPTTYMNLDFWFNYTPAASAAYATSFGTGCGVSPQSWYEFLPSAGPNWDMSDHTVTMTPNGSAYIVSVTTGAPTWFTPASTSLTASAPLFPTGTTPSWDDAIANPITLPFTLAYPSGTTTQIWVGSNGIIFLAAPQAGDAYGVYGNSSANVSTWQAGRPNFAVAYGDQDTTANPAYGIYYDVEPGNGAVIVTWITQEWWATAAGPTQTFQARISAAGDIEYRYQTVNQNSVDMLVGWTPGSAHPQPLPVDLTTVGGFLTGDGSQNLQLAMNDRPKLGTTCHMVTSKIRTGSLLGLTLLGFGEIPAGMPLDSVGMPGCFLYMTNAATTLYFATPNLLPVTTALNIPLNASIVGMVVVAQSATLTPNVPGHTLDLLSSNGLCIGINGF